jgi:cytochrome P450
MEDFPEVVVIDPVPEVDDGSGGGSGRCALMVPERESGTTFADSSLSSGCPVLRFGPRPDGEPPSELQAGSRVEQVAVPAGGEPLTVLRGREEVRACLTSRDWVMAGVTSDGELRDHPLSGAERQHPDGGLLNMDPPAHRKFRGRINHLFTPARAAAGRPHAYTMAVMLASALGRRPVVDLVADYSDPFIAAMICNSLGIPEAEWPEVLAGSINAFAIVDSPHQVEAADEGWRQIYDFYDRLIGAGGVHPDGIIAGIMRALDGFDHWQKVRVVANVSNGYPAAMVSLRRIFWELLTERRTELAGHRNRQLNWATLTNEILNTVALFPVALPRRAAVDTQLGGRRYAEGELVVPSLVAAAHDPRYAAPAASIAFGYGPHTCPGTALTRLWLECAVRAFFEQYPDAELVDPDPVWDGGTLSTPRDITVRLSANGARIDRPGDGS